MAGEYDPTPNIKNSDDVHMNDDLNTSELAHHHTIGESPVEAISLAIAKKYFDLRYKFNGLELFDPVFAPNLGSYPGYGEVKYYKDLSNIVHFKGLVGATGSVPYGTILFNLPVGFRPADAILFPTLVTGNALNRITIQPDGNVYVEANLVNTDWVNFNGITFLAEA